MTPPTSPSATHHTIGFGLAPTPFGSALLAWLPEGLCALEFCDSAAEAEAARHRLQAAWPGRALRPDDAGAAKWAQRVNDSMRAAPASRTPKLPLVMPDGSPFRQRVWQALREIPCGEVRRYGHIARLLGVPQSARAVGGAVAANPLGWVVPCHRVVSADGRVHHYRWGAERKRALLQSEGARFDAT